MSVNLFYKRNDTAPSITNNFTRSGSVVDITGATVKFKIMDSTGTPVNSANNACVVVSATSGQVRYDPSATDFANAGTLSGEFEITYNTGKIETWPNKEYVNIVVTADV